MVCHHATFFVMKPTLSENKTNLHTPETLRWKKFDHHYTVSKYYHLLITQVIEDLLSKHFISK